jgi:hypothetical protein
MSLENAAVVAEMPLDRPPPRRRRWLSVLLSLVIFGSGMVIGAGLGYLLVVTRIQYIIHHPEEVATQKVAALKGRLKLSEEQTQQIKGILQTRQVEMRKIWYGFQPRFEAEFDLLQGQVAGVLDQRQRSLWNTEFAKFRRFWIPPLLSKPSSTPPVPSHP